MHSKLKEVERHHKLGEVIGIRYKNHCHSLSPLSFRPFSSSGVVTCELSFISHIPQMAQKKVILKLAAMSDEKTKQKAIEAVADIYGIDSIAADLKDQKMSIIGEMDTIAIAKKLKKIGKIDIVSVGPAKEEKKGDKKDEKKDVRK